MQKDAFKTAKTSKHDFEILYQQTIEDDDSLIIYWSVSSFLNITEPLFILLQEDVLTVPNLFPFEFRRIYQITSLKIFPRDTTAD